MAYLPALISVSPLSGFPNSRQLGPWQHPRASIMQTSKLCHVAPAACQLQRSENHVVSYITVVPTLRYTDFSVTFHITVNKYLTSRRKDLLGSQFERISGITVRRFVKVKLFHPQW